MYPNIRDINALSPEEHAAMYKQLKIQAAKKFLVFMGIKAAVYTAIYFSVKKANSL